MLKKNKAILWCSGIYEKYYGYRPEVVKFHAVNPTEDLLYEAGSCGLAAVVDGNRYLNKYKKNEKFSLFDMNEYVDFKEHVFKQSNDRRCAFLRDDNLCKLCFEYGESALCRTCHLYPRHIEEFENVREISLSLSCPQVCKILLNRDTKVKFVSCENDESEEYEDFDFMLYSCLLDARDVMIEILQNRGLSIDVRAGMVLGLAFDMEKRLNDGRFFTIEELLDYFFPELVTGTITLCLIYRFQILIQNHRSRQMLFLHIFLQASTHNLIRMVLQISA